MLLDRTKERGVPPQSRGVAVVQIDHAPLQPPRQLASQIEPCPRRMREVGRATSAEHTFSARGSRRIEADGDNCLGHPNPSGKYHYHAMKAKCLFSGANNGDLRGQACKSPSPTVGWIYDGYPMKGPCECEHML